MGTKSPDARISLSELRLIAIVAPVGFLAVVLYLLRGPAHQELHDTDVFYVLGGLSIIVSGFSFLVFGAIERLERRVLEQNRHLSVLNQIAATAVENRELDDLLACATDKALEATHAHGGFVYLVDEETRELTMACERRLPDELARSIRHLTGDDVARLLETRHLADLARRAGFASAIALPVKAEGNVYGVLGIVRREEREFGTAEVNLLSSIAGQLGLATRNARLRERVLDRAVLEERERLGRELHDSLGQMVGYVNTQTLAMKKLLASGGRAEAERHLAEMEQTSERVGTDVREAILGLRTSGHGLLPSLRMYLADYARIAGNDVRLEADAGVEALRLRAASEIQLMRIVQEALRNVRRHAHARTATVRLASVNGQLTVEVADDGRGFERVQLAGGGAPSFGLQTMRERAEAIGGTFGIASTLGGGTTVTVRVPLDRTEEAAHARAAG
ncbi:MAG TPA: sensor histidine kinase [Gaiellaceae bacterium]|nr:sensor histidine kinase [Gaiellaceae bacterium]